jgi:hypothetical protein
MDHPGVFVSDGNAASSNSHMESVSADLLQTIANQIQTIWWNAIDGKRKSMAEEFYQERNGFGKKQNLKYPSRFIAQVRSKLARP